MANKTFNIEKIRKDIRKIHKDFISKVGAFPDKFDAEAELKLSRVSAKVLAVILALQVENVIDRYFTNKDSLTLIKYNLIKNNYHGEIDVILTKDNIVISKPDIIKNNSLINSVVFHVFDVDTYDWDAFAQELLNEIHKTIYNRNFSLDASIFNN